MDVRLHLLIWSTLAFLCVCGLEEGKHAAPRTIERQVGEHAVATCFRLPDWSLICFGEFLLLLLLMLL